MSAPYGNGIPYYDGNVAGTKATVKAGRGVVEFVRLLNRTAAVAFLRCYNKLAADVTEGTTAPDFVIPLAANEGVTIPAAAIGFDVGLVLVGATTESGAVTGAQISVLMGVS